MELSYELISQFAKQITKEDKKTATESTVYGTVVSDANGNKYVKLDGSDQLTPLADNEQPSIDSTTANANEGERVSVLIKNHTATVTGNISSPAARTEDVEKIEDSVSEIQKFDILVGEQLQAQEGYIKKLQTDKANVGDLTAATAKITELEAKNLEVTGELTAAKADITDLKATKIDADVVKATYATIESLNATAANIDELEAKNIDITNKLTAAEADIVELNTNKLSAKDADIKYANIDFGNITEAAIKKIFSDSGMIKDLVVGDGTITGELVGVTITGDLIKANTLMADKLVVRGSDGNYYKLNTDFSAMEGVEPVEEDAIHGSTIVANSITAEKISVKDLVAFGATIGGFHITNTSLYSGVKSSVDNTTKGVYLDSEGQIAIGDSNNFLRYFKDTDGTYKLAISAGSILLSSKGKSVEDAIDELENLEIGGRNLIRNSTNLANEDYYFSSGVATTPTKTVSGGIVTVKDASTEDPGLNVSISSEAAGVDLSAVTVTACGKNLLHFTVGEADTYVQKGNGALAFSSEKFSTNYIPCTHLQGQTVTWNHSGSQVQGNNSTNIGAAFYTEIDTTEGVANGRATYISGTNATTFAVPQNANYMRLTIYDKYQNETMLELGNTITDYEAYVSQSVVANADGTVEGLTPISPIMNIFAETAGVTVTATYNCAAALSSYQGITPFGDTDEIARLIIEELPEAFIFPDVKTTGQEYTLSFWLKVPDEADEGARMTVNGQLFNASTEWVKQVVTFTADSTDLTLEFADPGTYYIYHLQLEIGNKATDWTAAPEDVNQAIIGATDDVRETMIEQNANVIDNCEELISEAGKQYVKTDDYDEFKDTVEAQLEVLPDAINMRFTSVSDQNAKTDAKLQALKNSVIKHFSFTEDGLVITNGPNTMSIRIDNDIISFEKNGAMFGWWDGVDFHTGNIKIEVTERAQFGNFGFVPRSDGSLSFLKLENRAGFYAILSGSTMNIFSSYPTLEDTTMVISDVECEFDDTTLLMTGG